jgi:hyaluronoglucosaminidase
VMLNPAGMLHTDAMLLALMQAGDDTGAWRQVVLDHGVPEEFFTIAGFFDLPPDPRTDPAPMMPDPAMADEWLTALETLLWRWKAPLQREWYPFLMGLRGDILYQAGQMDDLRKAKVLPPLLNIAHRNRD